MIDGMVFGTPGCAGGSCDEDHGDRDFWVDRAVEHEALAVRLRKSRDRWRAYVARLLEERAVLKALTHDHDEVLAENADLLMVNANQQDVLLATRMAAGLVVGDGVSLVEHVGNLHTGDAHAGCDVQACEIAAVASDEASGGAELLAGNTRLAARVAALEKQLSGVAEIRSLVIRWHNTHNSTTTDHACGFCALLDELEAAFDRALSGESTTYTPQPTALQEASKASAAKPPHEPAAEPAGKGGLSGEEEPA